MNEKTQKQVLAHLQAKFDVLPPGTVLVPPTNDDDDSDVTDVEFNDPKLMKPKNVWYTTPGSTDPYEDLEENVAQAKIDAAENVYEEDVIINFISGYPYTNLRGLCRKLGLTPAQAIKRIVPLVTMIENCCWTPKQTLEAITSEADSLTKNGWEPGPRPVEPFTPDQLRDMVKEHFRPELKMLMNESIADLAYHSGSNIKDVVRAMVDIATGDTLSRFKYLSLDPNGDEAKWLLWPVEIADAAANCQWIRGAREEAAKEKEGK